MVRQVDAASVVMGAAPLTASSSNTTGQDKGNELGRRLGAASFRRDFGVDYAYYSGSMYRGISSPELVTAMSRAGFLSFLGAAGLAPDRLAADVSQLTHDLADREFGVNLLSNFAEPAKELATVELLLAHGVRIVEASAFVKVTPALVLFHLSGLRRGRDGVPVRGTRMIGKCSRPEVATEFLRPAPEALVGGLLAAGKITADQAELARSIPLCQDICVEADSGGHTDRGMPAVLLPAMQSLRRDVVRAYDYTEDIRIGLAGGIGTPQAVAGAFALGADFVATGSVNQCTVEAAVSDGVKDRLQVINVQDTAYCPAGDMFEVGALVQVLRKDVQFPARANKLHALYQAYDSWEDLPQETRDQIEQSYFRTSVEQVWQDIQEYLIRTGRYDELDRVRSSAKRRLARIFRWYYGYSSRLSFSDPELDPVNLQVHTGPALGSFNQWARGTTLENWRARHVDIIAARLMHEGAALLAHHSHRLTEEGTYR